MRPNALKSLNKSIKKLYNDSLSKEKNNLSKRKVLEYKSPMVKLENSHQGDNDDLSPNFVMPYDDDADMHISMREK